jgi:fimbrial isopeptide formation D2 family protein/uncharacterized repeat protein (TIGR01451 family)
LVGASNNAVPPSFVLPGGRILVAGQTVTFDLGTVTNNDGDANVEFVTLEFNALVADVMGNVAGVTLSNAFDLFVDGGQVGTTQTTTVEIVEPQLAITKGAVPLTVVGGDTITFTITVDHTGLSTSDAFDVLITDTIPAGLTWLGNVSLISGVAPTVTLSLPTVEFFWATIPLGAGPYQFTFQATVDATVEAGDTFVNTADLVWSTLPGVDPNERTYTDDDDAPTITGNPAASNPSKAIVATSEASTLGNDVTIGEVIRYRLQAEFTGGTFPNVTLVDTLPAGLTFLNDGDVRISFTADNPWTLEADLVGASNNAVPPSFVLPGGRILVAGQTVTFDLGTITNNDGDANVEFVTLEFNVLVANVMGNVSGVTLSNAFDLFVDGGQVGTTQTTTVEIVEPQLAITKGAVPLTVVGGDTITFTITVDHTGASTSDAFDVLITDTIPAGLTWLGNVSLISGVAPTVTLSLPTVEFFWATIPLNAGPYQFTIQATVDATVEAGDTFVNTANLVWSTLPGVDPNERTYTDDDDAPTITGNPAASNPSKAIVATSEPSTLGNDVTIGEVIRYRLQAEFTGGTFPNVTLVDTLPAGLTFLNDGDVRISFTADNPWTLEANLVGASNNAVPPTFVLPGGRILVAGQTVTFDLGTVTNNDGDANVEFVTLEFNALVADVMGNVAGVTLSNAFDLFVDGGQVDTTQTTTVEIVEPQLAITKGAVPLTVVGGDTITFTITVDHTGASTSDAFDVLITDTIPAGLTWAGNVTPLIGPAPTVSVGGLPTVEFFWSTIPLGAGPYQFTFQATVDATVEAGDTFVNTADLVWSTLPGVDPNERTYTDDDDAPTITGNPAASNPSKAIVATSEASTLGNDVTIGEIVRYRLQAQFTGGTFPNVTLVDTLPAGLGFLDIGEVRVSFTADNPWTLEADLVGASNNAVPPTFVLPPGRISVLGQTLTFDLGTVTNNDGDANAEFVTLEFNALVLNVLANQDGVSLSNSFEAYSDGDLLATSPPVDVTVVEPSITNTVKSGAAITPNGATYAVTFTNAGNGSAFDVRLVDAIPAALSLQVGSIQVTGSGPPPVFDASASTPALLDVVIAEVPAGTAVEVRYTTVIVDPSIPVIPNFVDLDYTSLPDSNGTPGNPTGSVTPGVPGSGTGERNSSGGLNDYLDDDDAELGSLGDFVWWDVNGSGSFDPGEPGLPNVTMILIWPGPDGDFDTPGDNVIRTTTTDANGNYFFNALPAGVYRVIVDQTTLPLGLANSYDLDGNLDSQVDVPLAEGQSRTDVDFGYVSVPAVIDDDDDNFSTIGNWQNSDLCTGFFGDSASWVRPGNGSECAVWTFNVLPGNYRVSATWFSPPEFLWFRATDAPFTLRDPNGTTADLRIEVNQKLNPGDYPGSFNDFGYDWMDLSASYAVTGGLLTVSLCNDASSWVVADAIRIERLPDMAPAPPAAATSWQHEPILSALPAPSGFGTTSGDRPNGEAANALVGQVLDNGQTGYSTVGAWNNYSGAGYLNDLQTANCAVCGNAIATWNFEGLKTGVTYQAYATWTSGANREANAIYRLFRDAPTPLKMTERIGVNQRLAPDDLFWDNVGWEALGLITPDKTTAAVQLTNAGSGLVVADGVLLVPVRIAARPQIEIELDGTPIYPSSSSVDFGSTTVGAAQQKTFVIHNTGGGTLVLVEPFVQPAGFAASNFGSTQLEPGQSTTLTLVQTAAAAGTFSGPVSIVSNDASATPFVFHVTGQVAAAEAILSTTTAATAPFDGAPAGTTLTTATARQIASAAIDRWVAAGITAAERSLLESATVEVRSLDGAQLSQLTAVGIVLDRDAAGHGWFVDARPWEDAEFVVGQPPAGIDLLTVVMREMGQRIGRADAGEDSSGLLGMASLPPGTRAVPTDQLRTGRNPVNPLDVDGDGQVAPIDVLLLLNRINSGGSPLSPIQPGVPPRFYDVTGDNHLSAADALLVINHLNGVTLGADSLPEPEADTWRTTSWTSATDDRSMAPMTARLLDASAIASRNTEPFHALWPAGKTGALPSGMSNAANPGRAGTPETSDPWDDWDDWDDLLELLADDAAEQWKPVWR